ncbi:MAG: tRNA (adenosine(37)-N6)-threonylcarbamoyltransferase complex ATPase subunit type 1 TsaE [Synechococcus lacustris]
MTSVYLANAEATQAYGQQLAQQLPPGALLLLKGGLGAGKTCLVQGLAAGLGLTEPVTSPTFALAQHYGLAPGPGGSSSGADPLLIHLDLYRLEQAAAADDLFCQEEEQALASGALMAVEWPERLSFVPAPAWQLSLSQEGEGRRAVLVAP